MGRRLLGRVLGALTRQPLPALPPDDARGPCDPLGHLPPPRAAPACPADGAEGGGLGDILEKRLPTQEASRPVATPAAIPTPLDTSVTYTTNTGVAQGTVYLNGRPLEGAVVIIKSEAGLSNEERITDQFGHFHFDIPRAYKQNAVSVMTYYVVGDSAIINYATAVPTNGEAIKIDLR